MCQWPTGTESNENTENRTAQVKGGPTETQILRNKVISNAELKLPHILRAVDHLEDLSAELRGALSSRARREQTQKPSFCSLQCFVLASSVL